LMPGRRFWGEADVPGQRVAYRSVAIDPEQTLRLVQWRI
jgi:hypothetical protein